MTVTAEDHAALHRLVLRYAQACDRRDPDGFAAAFDEAAILQTSQTTFSGHDALRRVPDFLKAYEKTYHTVLNCAFDAEGDGAVGEIYSSAHHLTPRPEGGYDDHVMNITYRDKYVRGAGGWKIQHRRVIVEFTEDRIVNGPR